MKKFLKILGLLCLVALVAVTTRYLFWKQAALEQIAAAGTVVDTAAGPIQYSLSGESGQVILFLHGTPGGFDHNPFFTPVSIPGYRWLSPSRPGYLATPLETGRTPEAQARAYAALLDTLSIDEVVVMSISGGGPSAAAFVAMYPERTRAWVALESLLYPRTEALTIPGIMKSDFFYWLGVGLISRLDDGRVLLDMFQLLEAVQAAVLDSPDGLERLQAMVWAGWPAKARLAGWENDSEQFMAMQVPLGRISVPTLVLQGTEDIQVSHAEIEKRVATMGNARLYTVTGGSHAMPLTHRDELLAEIERFLANPLQEEP